MFTYYYPFNAMIMLYKDDSSFIDLNSASEEDLISYRDGVIEGLENNTDFDLISIDAIDVKGYKGFHILYSCSLDGQEGLFSAELVVFVYNYMTYGFSIFKYPQCGIDYSEDYKALLDSIEFDKTNEEYSTDDEGVVGIEPKIDSTGNKVIEELDGFDYEIQDDQLILEGYNGDKKVLTIYSSYDIDGTTYYTCLDEFKGISSKVEAIIFEEGIETLNHAMFNFSDIQKVYFPITMTSVEDETLSYLHPEGDNEYIQIYYAGSQDQWANIFTKYDNMTMDKAESAEDYGTAAADWLNDFIGAGYDSSQFQYFFNATPDDLISSFSE